MVLDLTHDVARLRSDYYGPPTDIWSLGVILFLLLTGTYPFGSDDENPAKTIDRIKRGEEDVYFPSYLSAGATEIIRGMLKVDPTSRPTVLEILEDPWLNDDSELPDALFEEYFSARVDNSDPSSPV